MSSASGVLPFLLVSFSAQDVVACTKQHLFQSRLSIILCQAAGIQIRVTFQAGSIIVKCRQQRERWFTVHCPPTLTPLAAICNAAEGKDEIQTLTGNLHIDDPISHPSPSDTSVLRPSEGISCAQMLK